MNSDFPQNERAKLEAKLTALLLGELPADEVAGLTAAMEKDPELAALYGRLKFTIELVREGVVNPTAQEAEQAAPLKLSSERREKLLASFKTVAPKEFAKPRRTMEWLMPLAAAVVIVAALAAMLLPGLGKAKKAMQVSQLQTDVLPGQTGVSTLTNGLSQLDIIFASPASTRLPAAPLSKQELRTKDFGIQPPSVPAAPALPRVAIVLPDNGNGVAENKSKVMDLGFSLGPTVAAGADQMFTVASGGIREDSPIKYAAASDISGALQQLERQQTNSLTLVWGSRAAVGRGVAGEETEPEFGAGKVDGFALDTVTLTNGISSEPGAVAFNADAYDPKTSYRMLSQLGTDSEKQEVTLNYINSTNAVGSLSGKVPGLGNMPVVGSLFRTEPQLADQNGDFKMALTRDDVSGLRYLATNALVANGSRFAVIGPARVGPSLQPGPLMNREEQLSAEVPGTGDSTGFGGGGGFGFGGGAGAVPTARRVVGGKQVEIAAAAQPPGQTPAQAKVTSTAELADVSNEAEKIAPYFAAKEQLDEAKRWRQVLATKTGQETADVNLPRAQMVTVMNPATAAPSEKPSLGEKIKTAFSGKVERTASIQIDQERPDIAGVGTLGNPGSSYDPYFLQTEFETIKSDAVLKRVVENLKLDGGDPSKTDYAVKQLRNNLDLGVEKNSKLIEIGATSKKPEEAARIANAVAEAYRDYRSEEYDELKNHGIKSLQEQLAEQDEKIQVAQGRVNELRTQLGIKDSFSNEVDNVLPKPVVPPPVPQPEILTRENAVSTFSLNVSDVSFKLAAASLEKGQMPEPGSIRSEEFINAFDYRDPEAGPGAAIAFASERARYPFAQSRELLRFSLKTAAAGRQAGRPLNIVLLLDNSGSMERADRVRIIQEAMRVLAGQLQASDTFSIVTFARTARLRVDGIPGNQAAAAAEEIAKLTPEGGTNLGEALDLAYETALHHYLANGDNRVVLLTDGAANLGDVSSDVLKQKVEAHRQQGVALDCFGIGWEGYNDDLLEVLTRHGDGRYGFINTPEEASTEFVAQIAGALHVAASDVKVQVEFNPKRVTSYRQIGYAKHQLTKEQFRDNTVDAAEIAAQEAGNALYTIETDPQGEGSIATVRVRYKVPGTAEYREQAWDVPYTGGAVALDQASPAMRLAATASAFSEWLATSPFAAEVSTDQLLKYLSGVPQVYGADTRPAKLEWMIRQARSISGK